MVEYKISGLNIQDPTTDKIFTLNPVFVYKGKNDEKKVDKKIKETIKKYPKIKMERFDTTAEFPTSFAPNVIGGLTRGFVGRTLARIASKMPKEESDDDEEEEVVPAPKKHRSTSPPTAPRRSISDSSATRRGRSK